MLSKKLIESREMAAIQKAIMNSIYDGLYITDSQGITLDVNEAYTRITGIPRNKVVGRHMRELIHEGYFLNSASLMVLEKREHISIIDNIKGGIKCLTTGNPVFSEQGQIIRVVSCVRDMTELVDLKKNLEHAEKLKEQYQNELEHLRKQQRQGNLIGESKKIRELYELIVRVAEVDATVLILGETGVGKGLVAEEIHKQSDVESKPFIKVNCASIPESLLESELFGYEKGAFTGAKKQGKPGMFELANFGTIFLDEIGELPLSLQPKLLKILQDKEVIRIGGTRSNKLNVRIIAATNRDLDKLVQKGLFREDLYYRLNVIPIQVPSLRSRREDIPVLVDHFLGIYNKKYNRKKRFSSLAFECLYWYSWPGNVRELENLIERLVIISADDIIGREQLLSIIDENEIGKASDYENKNLYLKEAVSLVEKELITKVLRIHGSTRKAAKALGVSQPTVIRKAKKYGIKYNETKL